MCSARLRRTIREAKRMFYARTFLLCKNEIRKTWTVINDTDTDTDTEISLF